MVITYIDFRLTPLTSCDNLDIMPTTQWLFLFFLLALRPFLTCQSQPVTGGAARMCAEAERTRICVPEDYIKFELPEEDRATEVKIGVDIKDIPKVNDKDFSIRQ